MTNTFFVRIQIPKIIWFSEIIKYRILNTICYWENQNTEYRVLFRSEKIWIPNINSTIWSNYSNSISIPTYSSHPGLAHGLHLYCFLEQENLEWLTKKGYFLTKLDYFFLYKSRRTCKWCTNLQSQFETVIIVLL